MKVLTFPNWPGQITEEASDGPYKLWHKTSGVYPITQKLSPAWWAIVKVEGDQAKFLEIEEPGYQWRTTQKEMMGKLSQYGSSVSITSM